MERRAIAVCGIVQGVGFRPFVYGLAARLKLGGFVKNRVSGVLIEVEGDSAALDDFLSELTTRPPPLARIDHLDWQQMPQQGDREFLIKSSDFEQTGSIFISPDVATCADCLAELFDPADRRFHYPFLNCTNCGPRLTIITGAPYDRLRTTMAGFAMCPACHAEYEDPLNRRFHAQPTCCPACGPKLELLNGQGLRVTTRDPLTYLAEALRTGRIAALKGLGGYHLACAASSSAAVRELRRRKERDDKPFAVMVVDQAAAECLCETTPAERDLLTSRHRPIVLLRKRSPCKVADDVAAGNPCLGLMLPYTPVHHLLTRAAGIPLVMTSGNRSDEPIAYENADALTRLAGIADLFLVHNRPIHVRCDDSVMRIVDGRDMPLRRARGYAPEPLELPMECAVPIAAVGGQLKGAFALGRGHHAFVSHHLGDLDHFDAYRAFVKDLTLYQDLFDIKPRLLVHDLHPDYASTRYAHARSEDEGIPLLAVQHHHAHMAACMAEHGLAGPVIGVSLDGTGYGADGAIWGGEFLIGDYRGFQRAAHLRYVGMPGGDRAIREPWRMALAHLLDAGISADFLSERVPTPELRTIRQMLERRFNTPMTSSAGRLFDAVAAIANVRLRVSYEGQAAMELEWFAGDDLGDTSYPWGVEEIRGNIEGYSMDLRSVQHGSGRIENRSYNVNACSIDTRPIIRAVADDVRSGQETKIIARRFHATMAEVIAAVCERIRKATGIGVAVLSGGVFMNVLLTRTAVRRLSGMGFAVYRHHKVPTNDGGLSLGQLAIAAELQISD